MPALAMMTNSVLESILSAAITSSEPMGCLTLPKLNPNMRTLCTRRATIIRECQS